MQTFLPYTDFKKSAQCLDYRRLGKQRVEAWQIYKALTELNYGWKNHPIVKMWKGFEPALLVYGCEMCNEWIIRGFKDNMLDRFINELIEGYRVPPDKLDSLPKPPFVGNKKFHASHRSNLLRKDKKYYSQFGWKEPDNLPYKWMI